MYVTSGSRPGRECYCHRPFLRHGCSAEINALEARRCEVKEVGRLDAPSPLPPPESFMDTLDPIYRSFPIYRLLDETMRGELRVLLAREPDGGLKRTCRLVAQLTFTWRSHKAGLPSATSREPQLWFSENDKSPMRSSTWISRPKVGFSPVNDQPKKSVRRGGWKCGNCKKRDSAHFHRTTTRVY